VAEGDFGQFTAIRMLKLAFLQFSTENLLEISENQLDGAHD
jgi:hypothetical protein